MASKVATLDVTTEYERAELCDGAPELEVWINVKHGYRTLQGDTGVVQMDNPTTGGLKSVYLAALSDNRVYICFYARPPQGAKDSSSAQHILETMGPMEGLVVDQRGESIVAAFQLEGDDLIAFRDALNRCVKAANVEYSD